MRGYDGLIMGGNSYMLIVGRARRIDLLRQLRALVAKGRQSSSPSSPSRSSSRGSR
jgi:hypothetical protein